MAKTGVKLIKKVPSPKNSTLLVAKAIARSWKPVGKKHVGLRNTLVRPWETHNRPKFSVIGPKVTLAFVQMKIRMVGLDANQAEVTVYELLDKGTKVRHVRMTPGYTAQTSPGSITSGPKTGDVIRGVDEDPMIFRNEAPEGIEERNFDLTINTDLTPVLEKATDKGFDNGMRKVLS